MRSQTLLNLIFLCGALALIGCGPGSTTGAPRDNGNGNTNGNTNGNNNGTVDGPITIDDLDGYWVLDSITLPQGEEDPIIVTPDGTPVSARGHLYVAAVSETAGETSSVVVLLNEDLIIDRQKPTENISVMTVEENDTVVNVMSVGEVAITTVFTATLEDSVLTLDLNAEDVRNSDPSNSPLQLVFHMTELPTHPIAGDWVVTTMDGQPFDGSQCYNDDNKAFFTISYVMLYGDNSIMLGGQIFDFFTTNECSTLLQSLGADDVAYYEDTGSEVEIWIVNAFEHPWSQHLKFTYTISDGVLTLTRTECSADIEGGCGNKMTMTAVPRIVG